MILKANSSNVQIELINKKTGNGHWNTRKLGKKKGHMIHEGTLRKFYHEV